jgi:hypothetical protein
VIERDCVASVASYNRVMSNDPERVEFDAIAADEEALAERRASAIAAGRRKGGVAGAAMAGAMLALKDIYEGPPREEVVATVESPGEPGDIDRDGIEVSVGDVDVWAPPPSTS